MNTSERQVNEELTKRGWRVLRNGAPDFFCIRDVDGKRQILAIEVKVGKDRPSAAQLEVHDLLRKAGIPVHVIREQSSFDDLAAKQDSIRVLPVVGVPPPRQRIFHVAATLTEGSRRARHRFEVDHRDTIRVHKRLIRVEDKSNV